MVRGFLELRVLHRRAYHHAFFRQKITSQHCEGRFRLSTTPSRPLSRANPMRPQTISTFLALNLAWNPDTSDLVGLSDPLVVCLTSFYQQQRQIAWKRDEPIDTERNRYGICVCLYLPAGTQIRARSTIIDLVGRRNFVPRPSVISFSSTMRKDTR